VLKPVSRQICSSFSSWYVVEQDSGCVIKYGQKAFFVRN
jgi:hypothetical protein